MTSVEHLMSNGKSPEDEDVVVSSEVQDEDLRTRIKLIVSQIKANRNRTTYQNIYDHLKRAEEYREIDKNSDLVPFIDSMVIDGHLRNTGKEKRIVLGGI